MKDIVVKLQNLIRFNRKFSGMGFTASDFAQEILDNVIKFNEEFSNYVNTIEIDEEIRKKLLSFFVNDSC